MKKITKSTFLTLFSLLLLIGCNSSNVEETTELVNSVGAMNFGISLQNITKDASSTENGKKTNETVPTGILISIKDSDGRLIYNLERLTLVEINGSFISSSIELDAGKYTIEDFIVTDSNDTSIYITPKRGSEYENLVTTPLSYEFSVAPDETTTVELDVISASLGRASDFGYAEFAFNIIQEFSTQQNNSDNVDDVVLTNHELDDFVNKNWPVYPNFVAQAWTRSGRPLMIRSLLRFDLTSIPTTSEIVTAKLYLYGVAYVEQYEGEPGGRGHQSLTNSNAFEILRVTSEWDESTVSWNTRPSVAEQDKISLPESETEFQDYEIDVSQMVQQMVNGPNDNHGFMIKLTDESYYANISFASSDYQTDPWKRPKLEIVYK